MARRAFGPQRRMTDSEKARNVGESIQRHEGEGRAWTWQQYGLSAESAQAALVQQWLAAHQAQRQRGSL